METPITLWITIAIVLVAFASLVLIVLIILKKQNKLISQMIEQDILNKNVELKAERQKFFLPQRVEAYQRYLLFLNRITPSNIVFRFHNPAHPAKRVQMDILSAIREEFDHNIAQQLFISPKSLKMIKDAKEETIRIINLAGDAVDANALSMDYATKIMELTAEIGKMPTEIASDFMCDELQKLF